MSFKEMPREYLSAQRNLIEVATGLAVICQAHSRLCCMGEGVGTEIAVRISKAPGTTADLWLGLQMQYDLWQVKKKPMPRVQRLAA